MTEDEAAAQAQLREIVKGLSAYVPALEGVHHRLPRPVRTVIECVLHDQFRPAIEALQSAVSYRPPAEEGA